MIKHYNERHATYTSDRFLKYINIEKIKVIVEGGSRDLIDALYLEKYFQRAHIHSFECNEDAYNICQTNIQQSLGRIKLNKLAMCDVDGEIFFHPFDHSVTDEHDIGVSSIYRHIDQNSVPQKTVKVNSIRLDTYCVANNINRIDYLCLDVQGAEQLVLSGLGNLLSEITYIVLEDDSMFYTGATNVNSILLKDFELVDMICNDKLYIKK